MAAVPGSAAAGSFRPAFGGVGGLAGGVGGMGGGLSFLRPAGGMVGLGAGGLGLGGGGGSVGGGQLPGVRQWTSGVSLVSTGCGTLDRLLGGGLPRGGVVMVEEDEYGTHARALAQGFVSDAALHGHTAALAGWDGFVALRHYAATLPGKRASASAAALPAASSGGTDAPPSLKAGDGKPGGAAVDDHGLKIAWQYGKYLGGPGGGPATGSELSAMSSAAGVSSSSSAVPSSRKRSNDLANKLDFSKDLDESVRNRVHVCAATEGFADLATRIEEVVGAASDDGGAASVGRVAVLGVGEPSASIGVESREIVKFMHRLRAIARSNHATIWVTLCARTLPDAVVARCSHLADTVLSTTCFSDGGKDAAPEFEGYTGFLELKRHHHVNAIGPTSTDAVKFLFTRDRRRYVVERTHLPPEGSRSSGAPSGASTTSTTPSKASSSTTALTPGMACAPKPGGTSLFDF